MQTIIASVITGSLALLGVIFTNAQSNKRVEAQLATAQAITDVKLENLTNEFENLTDEVRKHNSFGDRITKLEEVSRYYKERIERLEDKLLVGLKNE